MKTLIDRMADHPFLKGIDRMYLERLMYGAYEASFLPGEKLISLGEAADRFYLIEEGTVQVGVSNAVHGDIDIQSLKGGDVLGWSWLIPPYEWEYDAYARAFTRTISIDGLYVRELLTAYNDFGYELMRRYIALIAGRLKATRLQYWDIYKQHYLLKGEL